MKRVGRALLGLGLALVPLTIPMGCGGSSKQDGATVEVSQDMLDEARNSDAYMDQQAKGGAGANGDSRP
jgi:hypothetical protein